MEIQLDNRKLTGSLKVIPSKSFAHRAIIGSALGQLASGRKTEVLMEEKSQDIEATIRVTAALLEKAPLLDCGESGTTLRLILPVLGALGAEEEIRLTGRGRLLQRPLGPLIDAMEQHGFYVKLREEGLFCRGRLSSGCYKIAANVSSQYISGLLMALPLVEGDSLLQMTGPVESRPYIDITLDVLRQFGIEIEEREGEGDITGSFFIKGSQLYRGPQQVPVEGDWSNGAFWLAAGAAGGGPVTVQGLNPASIQGDRKICQILRQFGADVRETAGGIMCSGGSLRGMKIDVKDIPDLVPVLAVLAAGAEGETLLYNGARLRLKESDRIMTTAALLRSIGAEVEEGEDYLKIQGHGGRLPGGRIDGAGDHRIVMSGAVAALFCDGPVTIAGAEAVKKSYPHFFTEREKLCRQ